MVNALTLTRRRELRRQATDVEKILWRCLRSRQLRGMKFRRQHSIGPYIVDFFCAARGLAVEADGGQHFTVEGQLRDERRSEYLAAQGVRVLRFSNREVLEELGAVLQALMRAAGK